jgi:hypothetical protein
MKKLCALFCLLICGQVGAAPVTWTLQGVTLDNGGTIDGSFVYDADTNSYSDIAIQAPDWYEISPLFTGENLTYVDLGGATVPNPDAQQLPIDNETSTSLSLAAGHWGLGTIYGAELDLIFASALTNGGGTIALVAGSSNIEYFNEHIGDSFTVVGGAITAVPIPAAIWLFGSALGALGWVRRRKTA